MRTPVLALLVTVGFSIVGVVGDYFLKLASGKEQPLRSPAFFIGFLVYSSTAFGWVYVTYGSVPEVTWLLYGIKPIILAVIFQAAWGLARKAARTWPLALLGVAAAAASMLRMNELVVLFGAGAIALASRARRSARHGDLKAFLPVLPAAGASAAARPPPASPGAGSADLPRAARAGGRS